MSEKKLPPADSLTDTEIYNELRRAGSADEKLLGKVFTEPVLAATARIERLVAENPLTVRQAAADRPVFELPYFQLPPDMELPIPESKEAIKKHLDLYHEQRDETLFPDSHLAWLEKSMQDRTKETIDPELWCHYQATYTKMKLGKYSLRGVVMDSLRWYDTKRGIHATEQYYFQNHLTKRYLTSVYRPAQIYPVRVAVHPQTSVDHERLAQAAGIMVDLMAADPYFKKDSETIDAQEVPLLLRRTLRAHDFETVQNVVRSSAVESLVRAVLPMIIEGARYAGNSTDGVSIARVVANDIPAKLTRLAPLGYSGPSAVYGVGLEGEVAELQQGNEALSITTRAQAHLAQMRHFANRHFHYPNLLNQKNAQSKGYKVPPMLRTGIGCPVRFSGELPSPISAFTDTLFQIYQTLEESQVGSNTRHPTTPPRYAQELYETSSGLSAITARDFKGIGRQAAKQLIASS